MAVDLRALRAMLMPEIRIAPGRGLMARVVAVGPTGRGSLSIAGLLVDAQLPGGVRAGDELRLLVTEVNQQRVLLTIAPRGTQGSGAEHAAASANPAQLPVAEHHPGTSPMTDAALLAAAVALPGGGTVAVSERDAGGQGGHESAARTVTLHFQASSLGAMDLQFALSPNALALNVTVEPAAVGAAQKGAAELRDTLAQTLNRAVSVTVTQRRQPLDVYA